jgi:hypothetical protein
MILFQKIAPYSFFHTIWNKMEMNSFGNKSLTNMTHPQGNIDYINELNKFKMFLFPMLPIT